MINGVQWHATSALDKTIAANGFCGEGRRWYKRLKRSEILDFRNKIENNAELN
jgi:hypothetical protein